MFCRNHVKILRLIVFLVKGYRKEEVKEEPDAFPESQDDDVIQMKVNSGSKIPNLMKFALDKLEVR